MNRINNYLKDLSLLLRSVPSAVMVFFCMSVLLMNLLANKEIGLNIPWLALDCGFSLSWLSFLCMDRVKLDIAAAGGVIRDTVYGADIILRAAFPSGGAEVFSARLTELSAGGLEMTAAGEEFLPGPREAAK